MLRTKELGKEEVKKQRASMKFWGRKKCNIFETTYVAEISESRDQKILPSKVSVAVSQWEHESSTEKPSDLDSAQGLK